MAESLARMNSPTARAALVALFKVAPENLALAVARSLASSREGANDLVVAVEKGAASPRLLQDRVVDERLHLAKLDELDARLAKLLEGLPAGDERVRELIAARKASYLKSTHDVALGGKLFEKNCAICHQLDGKGKKIGPELDGVGLRGLDRLLEDVLDPNRNVDANFRTSTILLKNGQFANGLVQREEGNTLIVVDEKGQERRVPIDDIDERKISKLSPMPANVSELMKDDEFPHLMAFLLDQKRKRETAGK
jgi:putative heme-binding domain-containing protein